MVDEITPGTAPTEIEEEKRMSRAVRFNETGGPEVLRVVEVAEPRAGPGEVRVAVRAAGLNPYDAKVRTGAIPSELPRGQGSEFAGVVDEVGAPVSSGTVASGGTAPVQVGDEVLGWTTAAAQADFVVVRSTRVAPKPPTLDWETAGSLGLVANTAARAVASLSLGPGDTVLVTGASGGVGILSAQFAKAAGATVVGTARASDHDLLRRLGIVPVAYGAGVIERLRHAAPNGYTAALDNVGKSTIEDALALGIRADRINSVAYAAGREEFGIGTIGGGKKSSPELAEFARAAAAGEFTLPVHRSFPLAEVRAAYERLENEHVVGKIVMTCP